MDEQKNNVIEEQTINKMGEYKEERIGLAAFSEKVIQLRREINKIVVGQQEAVALSLAAIFADGHALIEGVSGVAKTLSVRLLSRLIDACFSRIQFTSDLMPNDVLGTAVFSMRVSEFGFYEGPVLSNPVLVNEVNRAPAKTQAVLSEVMEGHQVTIGDTTHHMNDVYTITATQNLTEQEDTYRLSGA